MRIVTPLSRPRQLALTQEGTNEASPSQMGEGLSRSALAAPYAMLTRTRIAVSLRGTRVAGIGPRPQTTFLTETASHSEIDVTHSKQTTGRFLTETRIVPLPGFHRAFLAEQFDSENRISNRFWPKNRSCRKETIKPFLTGARIPISVSQFRAEFCTEFTPKQGAQRKKESGSRDASEQGKIASNIRKEKETL
jgi:hypothetical protein